MLVFPVILPALHDLLLQETYIKKNTMKTSLNKSMQSKRKEKKADGRRIKRAL